MELAKRFTRAKYTRPGANHLLGVISTYLGQHPRRRLIATNTAKQRVRAI